MGKKANRDQFVPIPGPKMLEAIGLVTVKWGALEFFLDTMLFFGSDPNDNATLGILRQGSSKERRARLIDIFRLEHAANPSTQSMIALIEKAGHISGERDQIVHSLFGSPETQRAPETAIATLIKNQKVHSEWAVTRPRIIATAQKIDLLLRQIVELQIVCGTPHGNSVLPHAWRHKSRL